MFQHTITPDFQNLSGLAIIPIHINESHIVLPIGKARPIFAK